jgi:hypothetical protein
VNEHDDERAVRLLRETLHERAAAAATDDLPVAAAPRTGRRVPALAGVAAAAVAAGVLVTGTALWRTGHTADTTAVQPPVPVTAGPAHTAPAGWVPVSSLGVEIDVPADWRVTGTVNDTCEPRDAATHLVSRSMGAVPAIACGVPLRGTLVTITPGAEDASARRQPADGRVRFTWVAPDRRASVVATGLPADADLLQRVLATARAVDVDSLGCPTVADTPSWDRPRRSLPPVRTDGVDDVVYCTYDEDNPLAGHRLVASGRLADTQRQRLLTLLGRAAVSQIAVPCGPQEDVTFYRTQLRLRTPAGVSLLTVHLGCRGYVGSADGQTPVTRDLAEALKETVELG